LLGKTALRFPAESKESFADPFQIITLGKSGLKSTLLGMGTGFSGYNRSSNITRAGVAESIIRQAYEKEFAFLIVLTVMGRIHLLRLHLKVFQGNLTL